METIDLEDTNDDSKEKSPRKCCSFLRFEGNRMAQGYAINGMARGAIIMSNLVFTTALIYLANEQAGCLEDDGSTVEDCKGKVYGFVPASLMANIAVVSGVMSAFLMPLIGAVVDYTDHRWTVGVVASSLMTLIQMVQIGTVSKTWFPMVILQALAGFFYQVEVMAIYAYLPDMARAVGEKVMTTFHANFTAIQFASQIAFLVVVIVLTTALGFTDGGKDDVRSGHVSQALNSVWIIICFGISWRMMDHVRAVRKLPEDRSLWTAGFRQVGTTISGMYQHYPRSLGVFYLAVIFAESAANSFTVVSVIYLVDYIDMTSTEVVLFFLVALIGFIPGTQLGAFVTHRTDPKNSWRMALSTMFVVTVGGALGLKPGAKAMSFVWGLLIGITLGWHYPTEGLIFSLCLPKGQDSELAGFFVYCTQILGWLPPLIFSLLVQAGVSQSWGVVAVSGFAILAVIVISLFPCWEDVLADVAKNDGVFESTLEDEVIVDKSSHTEEPANFRSDLQKTASESRV